MNDDRSNLETPASWAGVLAGILPFISFGLINWTQSFLVKDLYASGFDINNIPPFYSNLLTLIFLIGYFLIPVAGFGLGWVKGFPRWSYPYIGNSLSISAYMMNAATPGLKIFGYTFGPRDLWGIRACIPFALVVGIALLVTRSWDPLARFIESLFDDWTRLAFLLFSFMPLLVFIAFDEIDDRYGLPYQIALVLAMASATLAYLRSRRHWQRGLALLAGNFTVISLATAGPILYWLENGWVNVPQSIIMAIFVFIFMMSPAITGFLRRPVPPSST